MRRWGIKDPLDQEGITRFTYTAKHVLCLNCDSEFFNVEVTGMFNPESDVVFVMLCKNCYKKAVTKQ
mgnify:CR=1 FL=1|jgi:hypothetical protein